MLFLILYLKAEIIYIIITQGLEVINYERNY